MAVSPVLPRSVPASLADDLGVRVVRGEAAGPDLRRGDVGTGRLWHSTGALGRIVREAESESRFGVAVMAVVEGRARFELGGRACELEPGGVTFLHDGLRSAIETDGPAGLVSVELPQSACARIEGRELAARAPSDTPTTRLLHGSVRALWDSVGSLDAVQSTAALTAVAALARVVTAPLLSRRSGSAVLVEEAMEIIERDLQNPELDASAVADARGVGRRYLDGAFRRETGTTVDRWLWERRLVRASDLLGAGAQAEVGVYGVALECGFTSASHFSRAFRRRFGVSPSGWSGNTSGSPTASLASA